MKKVTLLIFLIGFTITQFNFAQGDQPSGQTYQYDVPQNIKLLQQQIKLAEDNEDWATYNSLRPQLINALQVVNPQLASRYKNVSIELLNGDAPLVDVVTNSTNSNIVDQPMWATDVKVHNGNANDISLVVGLGDTLYLGVLSNYTAPTLDSISIYRSVDAGATWTVFKKSFFNSNTDKIELMDFRGTTGPSYLLLFYRYESGVLWCTRYTPSGVATHSVVADNVGDFAVDRNYTATDYRAMVLYDSTGWMHSVRSEPSSYASVWQDDTPLGILGKDMDFAYGYVGSGYAIFNGGSSGNLYIKPNYNYMDPSSWQPQITIETGNTDTTFSAEIIASRQDTSSQTVMAVYNWVNNGRYDLRYARKIGGSSWSTPINWSSSAGDNKLVELYNKRSNANDVFQASFTRTGLNNVAPREIRYRKYSSGSWNVSDPKSDASISVTGLVGSSVVELANGTACLSYVGVNSFDVYFDNEAWVTDVTPETGIPEVFSLQQNYPNPFNPSTTIKFSIPEQTNVTLKIFNSIGQEVASLLNGEMAAGNHSVDFNASKLSSGVYFYRIDSPSFTSTKKMILIK